MKESLLVRCSFKMAPQGQKLMDGAKFWAIKNLSKISPLPASLKVGDLHKMSWGQIESSVVSEAAVGDFNFHPLYDDRPDKVIGIGLNYKDHCDEQTIPEEKRPKEPLIFNKFSSTIITSGCAIVHPGITDSLDYEVELAVVIGAGGKNINQSDALKHVFGYSVANDVTARDWQKNRNGRQWLLGKSMDTFCPLGPGLKHHSQIEDPHNLNISSRVNGEARQSSNTSNLLFNIPHLISFISSLITLHPGDIILTGTPGGVGAFFSPPKFMNPGDVVKCSIEGIGEIENEVTST